MITATCQNNECSQRGQGFAFIGEPELVMCGACGEPTAVSDPRPDPPMPEENY